MPSDLDGDAMKPRRPTKEEVKRAYEIMANDLCKFARIYCDDVLLDDVPPFHREIYSLLQSEERLLLVAPRGFAKSTLVSKVYPLWLASFKKRKDICIISNSESLAVEHLRYIKVTCESNMKFRAHFGELKSEKWTESHIILQHLDGTRVNIRAKGAGGQIRGYRPDCVICDDLETDESVMSEEQRKKLKEWLFRACLNTLLPGGQFLVIGTLIHQLSVLSDLMEMPNKWEKRRYKAYHDGIEDENHALWPEARPHKWLQQRKSEIGSTRFAAEYMNDPKADDSAPIKSDHIRYWDELPKVMNMVIAVDPAYSEDEKADYKVAVLIGIDSKHNRYLVDYIRTHNPTGEFIDGVLNLYQRHKGQIVGVGVPNSGTEKQFYKSFEDRASERGVFLPLASLTNTFRSTSGGSVRNKKDRITAALQPIFEQGRYYINESHIEAREELLTIGSSRWDDLVDAMSYAEQLLIPVYFDGSEDMGVEDKPKWFEKDLEPAIAGGYGIEY